MGCNSSTPTSSSVKKTGQKEKVTLGYFEFRGAFAANPARYLMNYCKVQYDDKIYIMAEDEWKNSKMSLGLDFPSIPYFFCDDLKITETIAIHQFIASKWCPEVLGKTPQERANNYRI